MQKPVIVAATRTAIGTFGGTLSQTPAPELAAITIREALRRAGNLPGDQSFSGTKIDLGGMNYLFTFAIRF